MFNRKAKGDIGEELATQYLKKLKYKILDRNFRTKTGEVDIIAQKDGYIVFVEVKTRTSTDFGEAREAVNYRKQQKIIRVSQEYLGKKFNMTSLRYDVIEVYLYDETEINHIQNAFGG